MKEQLSIGIFSSSFTIAIGGGERLCHDLTQYLHNKGHKITIFSNNAVNDTPVFNLPEGVNFYCFNFRNPTNAQMLEARKILTNKKIDVFISFTSSSMQLFLMSALMGTGIPSIYSELVAPSYSQNIIWNPQGRLAAMSGADIIHMLLPAYGHSLPSWLQPRLRIIPSPAPVIPPNLQADISQKTIISLGGQLKNKNIDCLIKAFELIAPQFPEWYLEIWGKGPEASRFRRLAETSKAATQIRYQGFAPDALQVLRTGSIFCIPSLSEGMPITLLEAMSLKLPAVGFADCTGVNQLIQHEKNGLLASEVTPSSLAQELVKLMSSEDLRIQLGQEAYNNVQQYNSLKIFQQWEDLIFETAAIHGNTQLDAFSKEPFKHHATLSAAARREYILRDFGHPMPGTLAFLKHKIINIYKNIKNTLQCTPVQPVLPQIPQGHADIINQYITYRRDCPSIIRRILSVQREDIPALDGECGLPAEHIATGWHHAMLGRYLWASHLFPEQGEICDLGSGLGWGAVILAQRAASVTCVERNPACASIVKYLWPTTCFHWHTTDILTFLPQADANIFDGITCMEVMEHLSPEKVQQLLQQAARCLRSNALIICSSSFPIELTSEHNKYLDNPFHEHIYTQSEIMTLSEGLFSERYFIGTHFFIGRK